MSIELFIQKIENEFDDIPKGVIQPESYISDFIEVNSLNIMIITLLLEYDYNLKVNFDSIRNAETFKDLYALTS